MGRMIDDFQAMQAERVLRAQLPTFAAERIDAAITLGATPDDALELLTAAPNGLRGGVVLLLHHRRAPVDVFRAVLDACWNHDHDVLRATAHRNTIKAMFSRAAFTITAGPAVIRAWRGTSGGPPARAAAGLSWTTDRDTACWFACSHRRASGDLPMVLRIDAPRSAFLYQSNERQEAELVTFDARKFKPTIDGDSAEWLRTGEALEKRREAQRLKDLT